MCNAMHGFLPAASQCAVDLVDVALCLAKDLVAPWSKPLEKAIDTISTAYGLMKVRSRCARTLYVRCLLA
jgi:hypothetical protein